MGSKVMKEELTEEETDVAEKMVSFDQLAGGEMSDEDLNKFISGFLEKEANHSFMVSMVEKMSAET